MTWNMWSKTAASNATADPTINWAEGQSPSSVNDSARAMMAAAAKFRDDISGALTSGGTSVAYTLTSNQTFSTLALMAQKLICMVPHTTCGATVTLNVDSLGAKPLRSAPSTEVPSGTLIMGTPYLINYNSTDAAFYLYSFFSNPYQIPIGMMAPYLSSTAPNSSFALPYGQAISRTTYATLFSLISTTFGTGDGSTTFNIPDLRGRTIFGLDNMGGSAANRVTTNSGITATNIGATGGGETVTIAQANIPSYSLTVTDPGHTHTVPNVGTAAYTGGSQNALRDVGAGLTTTTATTGITVSSGGSGTALNKMPPTIVLPYVLRVI